MQDISEEQKFKSPTVEVALVYITFFRVSFEL